MSERSVQINLRINFPVILFAILLLHALILIIQKLPSFENGFVQDTSERTPLNIRSIRTVGSKESKIQNSAYLSKNDSKSKEIFKDPYAPIKSKSESVAKPTPKSLSLSDLSETRPALPVKQRPGNRPVMDKANALSAISLKGSEMQKFAQGSNANTLSGDPRAASLSNSDVMVNLEVPEGVNPDQLNEYELMFYGFQRRTAINYVNAFYKKLDKFQQENPHLTFPMTDNKQVMTGRLTYDSKGNVKQIKMIRWSNEERLQNFFEEVLKDMDTLHNPPQALWEKSGEFSIFFSFVVNG